MNNRDRAADVIRAHGTDPCREPECIAQDLADEGLLAPDLPEPDEADFVPGGKGWLPGGPHGPSIWTAPDSTVMVQRIEPGDLTPAEARKVAHALLAAANYTEEGNQE
mgnify:CR=1 FL=1